MKLDNLHTRFLLTLFFPFVYYVINNDFKEPTSYIKVIKLIWTRDLK